MSPVVSPVSLRVDADAPRLDAFLARALPHLTRSRLQTLIRNGHVSVNGHPAKPASNVKLGDAIEITLPSPTPSSVQPEAIPLNILHEDTHLLVLNKPPGLVTHPAPGHSTGTLVHALLHHCQGELSGIGGVQRPGIVHRLDKDTSGALLVAKSDLAHHRLVRLFQSRAIAKTYLALAARPPRSPHGRIEAPIARHPVHRKRMAVLPHGRPAITLYRLLEAFPNAALLECDLLTGRTHQIRVHLAHIQAPLLGDPLYGRFAHAAPRQMLHAWRLAFPHPITQAPLRFEAPLAPDFQSFLTLLRQHPSTPIVPPAP